MTDSNKKINLQEEIAVGEKTYREAQVLIENSFLEGAVSRLYYAAFHFACAVLLSAGLEAKTHKGVLLLLKKNFVDPGLLDPKLTQIIARAEKYREESDYRHDMVFTLDLVLENQKEVRSFMDQCLAFLKSKSLVS